MRVSDLSASELADIYELGLDPKDVLISNTTEHMAHKMKLNYIFEEEVAREKKEDKAKKMAEVREKEEMEYQEYYQDLMATPQDGDLDPNADLRAPIVAVLGHVDTGKTTLLDNLRATNVQKREVGGITQRISAAFLPRDDLQKRTAMMDLDGYDTSMRIPGLLVIDTPGHAPFEELRARGANFCDIGVVIVNITKPELEQQTLSSIKLLRARQKPFVVLVNKVDRLYGWESNTGTDISHGKYPEGSDFKRCLVQQSEHVRARFDEHLQNVKVALAEEGLNSQLYFDYTFEKNSAPLVPASGKYSEGLPSLLWFLSKYAEQHLFKVLAYRSSEIDCTILEVGKYGRQGWAVDAILKNGELRKGATIAMRGESGLITRTIRSLFTEDPLLPGWYMEHEAICSAVDIKIGAHDIQDAVADSPIVLLGRGKIKDTRVLRATFEPMARPPSERGYAAQQENAIEDDEDSKSDQDLSSEEDSSSEDNSSSDDDSSDDEEPTSIGMRIHAPTKNLAATLKEVLQDFDVPVQFTSIGTPLTPLDVKKVEAANKTGYRGYAVILCFEHVKVPSYVRKMANSRGVTILEGGTFFEVQKAVKEHFEEVKARKRQKGMVFPCELRPIKVSEDDKNVFTVRVVKGTLHLNTPLIVCKAGTSRILTLGTVCTIEKNRKPLERATNQDDEVEVNIHIPEESHRPTENEVTTVSDHRFYSHVTAESVRLSKALFKNEISVEDWKFMKRIKRAIRFGRFRMECQMND